MKLKHPLELATCVWRQDWEGNWETGCGTGWICEDLKESEYNFCPKCGKKIKEVALPKTKEV